MEPKIEIVSYSQKYKDAFKELNTAWIEKHFSVEENDVLQLNHPEEIINNGGLILILTCDGKPIGTAALIKEGEGIYELAKMSVQEEFKGKGLGLKLGKAILDEAKKLGAKKVELLTNSKLTPALNLYQKLGFISVDEFDTHGYKRCNVKMEIEF